jgi:hypothetical protein
MDNHVMRWIAKLASQQKNAKIFRHSILHFTQMDARISSLMANNA